MSPYFCINVCKCIHLYSPLFRKKRIKMKKVSFYSQTYEQTSFFLLNLLIQFTAPHAHAHAHTYIYICVCARACVCSFRVRLSFLAVPGTALFWTEISDAVPGITAPIACIYYTQSVHIYTLYIHYTHTWLAVMTWVLSFSHAHTKCHSSPLTPLFLSNFSTHWVGCFHPASHLFCR